MATLSGQYKLAKDNGLLHASVTEEGFATFMKDPAKRKEYYDYVQKNKPGFYSEWEKFNKNVDDMLAGTAQPSTPAVAQEAPQAVSTMPVGAAADSTDAAITMLMQQKDKEQKAAKEERARINAAQLPMSDDDRTREEQIRNIDATLSKVGVERFGNRMPIGDEREDVLQQQKQLEQERATLQGQRKNYMAEPTTVEEARESWIDAWSENTEEGKQAKADMEKAVLEAQNYLLEEFKKSDTFKSIYADVHGKVNRGELSVDAANKELNTRLEEAFVAENEELLNAEKNTQVQAYVQRALKADNGWLKRQEERLETEIAQNVINVGYEDIAEEQRKEYEEFSAQVGDGFAAANAKSNFMQTQQYTKLGTAYRLYQQAETRLHDTKKREYELGSFTKDTFRHLKDLFPGILSGGATDVADAAAQTELLLKIAQSGGVENADLTNSEAILYDAMMTNLVVEAIRKENTAATASAGKTLADMIPFIIEIAAGRGLFKGMTEAAQKSAQRAIIRSLGRGKWSRVMASQTGELVSGLISSTLTAAIAPSTYQHFFEQQAKIEVKELEFVADGFEVDHEIITQDAGKAYLEALKQGQREIFTETGGMTKFLKGFVKATPLGKMFQKSTLGEISRLINDGRIGKFFKQTAYDGIAEEWLEEAEGTFYDAVEALLNAEEGQKAEAFGNVYGEFFSPEVQVPMLIAFSVPAIAAGGVNGSIKTGRIIWANTQYKRAYKNLHDTYIKYGATEEEFEDALNELVAAQLNVPIEQYPDVISAVATTLSGGNQAQADEFAAALSAYMVADANLGAIQEKHAKKQRQVQAMIHELEAAEQRIAQDTHTNGMMYHVEVGGNPGYFVRGILPLEQYKGDEFARGTGDDIVTVRMEDGSVKQVPARDVTLLEQPQTAENAIEFERRRLTAKMNNLDRFKVGDVIYITENGQPVDGSSSRVVDVTDEGIVTEMVLPDGTVDTTTIPHDVAESGLSTSDELVEEGAESAVVEMPGGTLVTMQKTATGDWMQVAPKTDNVSLISQREFDEMLADSGAKVVGGSIMEQPSTDDVASGNGVVSEEAGEIEQPTADKPYATDEQGNPLWADMNTEQAAQALLSEVEGDKELAKQFAQAQVVSAKAAVNKANKRKPQATNNLAAFKAEAQAIKQEQEAAQAELSKWENIVLGIANYKTEAEQAEADAAAQRAAEQRAQRKQTIEGVGGGSMAERLAASPRIDGNAGSITAADGTKIPGHYVLVSANALTPSHNPNANFAPSEGYPTVDGQSINDRDYQADQEEQAKVQQVAQTYDGRAITNMPIVSDEGLVYSGNGRTMAGQLAAANGTDGAYTEALMENATQFGFTAEQVESVPNARVVFMTDERLPYNTTTLALFNQNEQQTQSNTASAAANVRKLTPEAVGHIIAAVQEFDTVDAFFGDSRAPFELVNRLIADGIISERDKAAFVDNGRLTNTGKDRLTALLFGTAFDEKTIRLLGDNAKVRNSVMRALPQILENKGLGDFSLFEHINNAIAAIYDMDTNGMSFFEFTRQIDIEGKTASDKYTAFELLLVDEMVNGGVQAFRNVLNGYNARAKESAGGQLDMFTGEVLTKEVLTKQILQEYEQREANERGGAQPESAAAGTSESDGEKVTDTAAPARRLNKDGNPIDGQGNLLVEQVESIDDITDEDFDYPYRNIALPALPNNVANAIGTNGRPVVIKKNIFEKNLENHTDLLPEKSREILRGALYNTTLYGTTQPISKPDYKVVIKTGEQNAVVVIDVYQKKDKVEIVGWRLVNEKGLERMKRQAEREDGQLLILSPEVGSAAALSALPSDVAGKGTKTIPNTQEKTQKSVEEQQKSGKTDFSPEEKLAAAEAETDTNPTEAQKKAENYKQGHVTLWGLPFTIENPKGSVRRGTDANGKQWEQVMNNTYGKIRRTEGVDGDHIDVFFGPNLHSDKVFVVDQLNVETQEFDEHKVMLGFDSMEEAQAAYLSNYEQGWQGMGPVTETTMDEFKKWIDSSHRKTKPFNEYKSVKQEGAASGVTTPVQKSVSSGKKASNKTEKTQGSVQKSAQLEQKNAESNEKTQNVGKNAQEVAMRIAKAEADMQEFASKLGAQGVHLISNKEQLPNEEGAAYRAIRNGANVMGWYNPKTNQVYIYLPNANNLQEVYKTLLHEFVAHKGLRDMLGKEKFDQLCHEVWDMMSEQDKLQYALYVKNNTAVGSKSMQELIDGMTEEEKAALLSDAKLQLAAADEYMAHFAETGVSEQERSIWQRIVDAVRDLLRKAGINLRLTDADIARLLYESSSRLSSDMTMRERSLLIAKNNKVVENIGNLDLKARLNDDVMFKLGTQIADMGDNTLVGLHNISTAKLRKAIKQGGLANPSVAVINMAIQDHEQYGDITLVMPSSMIDSTTGRNAGTYTGDIWSPTYPYVERKMSSKGSDKYYDALNKAFEGKHSGVKSRTALIFVNMLDNQGNPDNLAYWYMLEKGIAPTNVIINCGISDDIKQRFEPLIDKRFVSDLTAEERELLLGIAAELEGKTTEELLQAAQEAKKRYEDTVLANEKASQFSKNIAFSAIDEIDTYGVRLNVLSDAMRRVREAIDKDGGVDVNATISAAVDYVQEKGLKGDFDAWLDNLDDRFDIEEVIFDGYTRDGDRKYVKNTIANASRLMNQQPIQNATSHGGLSATRGQLVERMSTLAQIRANKHRLAAINEYEDEQWKAMQDEWFNEIINPLSEMQEIDDNTFINMDIAEQRLLEAIMEKDPIAYLNREYRYKIEKDSKFAKALKDLMGRLKALPSKYFETKFKRPVMLNEFVSAVVPQDLPQDLKDGLANAGLELYEYDEAQDGSRREATLQATEAEGVRFSIKNNEDNLHNSKKNSTFASRFQLGRSVIDIEDEWSKIAIESQRESMPKTALWHEGIGDVIIHTNLPAIKTKYSELHAKAKAGDVVAARELVRAVVKRERVKELAERFPNAIVAFPHAEEASGKNKIPAIYAVAFEAEGLKIAEDIIQSVKPHHTGSDKISRFVRRARYDGEVVSGREYIIIDDHVTMGGTLRDLKDYIESKGGKVVAVSTITASAGGTKLVSDAEQINALQQAGITNEQLKNLGIADNIYGITKSEARELLVLSNKRGAGRTPQRSSRYFGVGEKTSHLGLTHNSEQISSSEVATNEDAARFRISNDRQRIFVSNAEKAVEGIKQEKATPQQWLAMLEKNGGIKAGEDKWLGLSEWLKEQDKKSITKQEILDFISENQIQIEEVEYGDADIEQSSAFANLQEEFENIYNEIEDDSYDDEEKAHAAFDELAYRHYGGDDFSMAFGIEDGRDGWRLFVADEKAAGFFLGINVINPTRFKYTTDGLDAKREIALTVPTIESWNEGDEVHFGDAGGGRAVAWVRFGETTVVSKPEELLQAEKDYKDFSLKMIKQYGFTYTENVMSNSEMQQERELLAKLRQAQKEHPKVESKVLVIDEIQSKRHQEGREKGYKDNLQMTPESLRKLANIAQEKYEAYTKEPESKYKEDYVTIYPDLTDAERTRADELEQDVYSAQERLESAMENERRVPDAPFDKNWHELAMKRMLRYAAENGYDYVAWTTGAQQAERYNIGDSIESLEASDWDVNSYISPNPTKYVEIEGKESSEIDFYVDKEGRIYAPSHNFIHEGDRLSDVVGKELAVQILQDGHQTFDPDNARIGGEGMKGFYDLMLPSFVSKYTKKWGAKVQDINLPNLEESAQTMHAVNITESMKEDVMEGQPMFRITEEENRTPLTEAQQLIFDGLADVAADAGIDIVEVSDEEALKAIENSSNKPLTNPINGKILGYAQGGTIYLTKAGMTPKTMVHEYTHIWAKAMQRKNRAGWENIKQIFRESLLWNDVVNDPNYQGLKTDDAICSEVLARYSGKYGAERLDEVAREMILEEQQSGSNLGAARVRALINRARTAIKSFWKWVGKNLFGITKFDRQEDVADRVLYDLLNATDLDAQNNEGAAEKSMERPSPEFVEAMRAWNAANPYPVFGEDGINDIAEFRRRLNAWNEARDAYRRHLYEKATEEIETADPIVEPLTTEKPIRRKDETAKEYAQRLKLWQDGMIDRKLQEEYTAEMNRLASTANQAKRAFIDAAQPIEEWQNWLVQRGAEINGDSNAYQDMFLAQGRVTDAADDMRRNIIQPLANKIGEIIDSKKLDSLKLRWSNMDVPGTGRKINGERLTPREIIGVYCQAKDCEEAEEKGLPDRGKDGFINNLGVSYDTIVSEVESRLSAADVAELWGLIRKATKYALEYDYKSGRISEDTYNEFQDREYYVPQRGWRERDESGLIEEYEPVGKRGHDPYNAALVKARGRKTLAADPFAYIMSIDHSSIVSSENNKIKQKMLQFCLDNERLGLETGAFRVKKFWLMHEIDPDTGKILKDEDGAPIVNISYTEPSAEDKKKDNQTKEQIKRIQKDIAKNKRQIAAGVGPKLETALQAMIARWEKQVAELEDTLLIAFGATNTHISQRPRDAKLQHEVQVMKDGQRYVIELQDEKVANAINKRFKEHQQALFSVSDKIRNATRFMSAMLTQYNPEFAFSNFVRDYQVALATLLAENPKLAPAFVANFAMCQRAVWAYAFNDRVLDRKKFVESDMGRYLQEYMASGAPTGFSYMQDLKSLRKDFDKMVKENNVKRGIRAAAGMFALMTEWSETAVRFSAYVSARKAGWSVNDAAYMSKELTTNFDRAGERADSGWMAWFSFFRATINGNIKFFRAFKKFPIAYSIIAAAYFAAGIANQFMNPNDPEDEVWASDYVRENNFVIGKWRIPAAHFMRIFFSAGVNMVSWMQGERTFGHAVYNSAISASNEILPNYMNVPGIIWEWSDEMQRPVKKEPYMVLRELAPTPVSPIADVWLNRNFMGGKIIREPFARNQNNVKNIAMTRDNTLPIYRAITEEIYTAVGGDLNSKYKSDDNAWTALFDISGSQLEHVVEGYAPAAMDMLATTANMIYDAVQGNELTPDKLAFIRKFYNPYTDKRAYDQQYWLLTGIVQEYERTLRDHKKNNPDKYKLDLHSKQYKAFKDTHKLIREQIEEPTKEDVKRLMEANKQWVQARTMIPVNEKVQQWANKKR